MLERKSSAGQDSKISIITVVLNDATNLARTVDSISRLTYENIEYILVDGGSTDDTLKVIDNSRHLIDRCISEEDRGLYDAMNKGIDLASGEWVIFMNAGDVFSTGDVLNEIFKNMNYDDVDIIYGDTVVSYSGFEKYKPSGDVKDIRKGMQFSHQSVFIKLDYHKKNKYKINNRICADFEFFYDASKRNRSFLKVHKTISSVLTGGVSDRNREQVFFSWWKVVGFGSIKLNALYFSRILLAFLKRTVKIVLPIKIIHFVIQRKA